MTQQQTKGNKETSNPHQQKEAKRSTGTGVEMNSEGKEQEQGLKPDAQTKPKGCHDHAVRLREDTCIVLTSLSRCRETWEWKWTGGHIVHNSVEKDVQACAQLASPFPKHFISVQPHRRSPPLHNMWRHSSVTKPTILPPPFNTISFFTLKTWNNPTTIQHVMHSPFSKLEITPPPFNTWCHCPFSTHHHSTRDAIAHSQPTAIQHVMPLPILKAFWHQVTNLNTANLFPTQAARYRSTMLSAWPLSPCTSYSLAGFATQWLTRCFMPWRPGWFYQGDGFVSIVLKIKLKRTTRQAERWGEKLYPPVSPLQPEGCWTARSPPTSSAVLIPLRAHNQGRQWSNDHNHAGNLYGRQ